MSNLVYHYTDTARLPWILLSKELQPGQNSFGGFPDPDFLWATTSPRGDRSSSASVQAMRAGMVRFVRFVLRDDDFEPWPEIVKRYPAWTPEQVTRLEHYAEGQSRPKDWRCRDRPLPIKAWLDIETKAYTDPKWRPLPMPWRIMPFETNSLGVVIEKKVYVSTSVVGPHGRAAYVPVVLDAEAA